MKRYIRVLFAAALFLYLAGCNKKHHPLEPVTSSEVIIPLTTKGIPAQDFDRQIVSISSDSTTFIFRTGLKVVDNLQPDDIIVSDQGLGVLRRIRTINKANGQITLHTVPATITEAVQKGSAAVTKTLTPNDTLRTLYRAPGMHLNRSAYDPDGFFIKVEDVVLYDEDGNADTENDQIVLNGSLALSPSFTFALDLENWKLKTLTMSSTFAEDLELNVNMTATFLERSVKKEIYRTQITPITIFIGWFPVVITPVLSVVVGADGRVYTELSSSISQHADLTAGLKYENDRWTPFEQKSFNFDFEPPSLTAGAELKGFVGPRLDLLLYGVVGPQTDLSLYSRVDAQTTRDPWLILYAGLDARVGIRFEVFSHAIAGYSSRVLAVEVKLWESSARIGGNLSGSVKDASTFLPLDNVKIDVYRNEIIHAIGFSNSSGTYEIAAPEGDDYRVSFSKPGFLSVIYQNVDIVAGQSTILETVLQIDQDYSGVGNIRGMIKNALNGSGIDGVILNLRAGINATSGAVIATAVTTAGAYSLNNIPAGNYTVEAGRSGFNSGSFSVICLDGQTVSNQDATLSPILSLGETRIVLTWGETPRDLDSHFTGPLPSGNRFHMYYIYNGNRSPWPEIVNLDLDDVSSFGPETTTLYQQIDGTYRFSVHDYSNKESSNSLALSQSGAQVRVYQSSGLIATFNVPPNTGGTLWTVFEMNGSTITPINRMSYEFNEDEITRATRTDAKLLRNLPIK